jgi:hypothetical protein
MKTSTLLAAYLEVPEAKAARLYADISADRAKLLQSFEYLSMVRDVCEEKGNVDVLTMIEGVLFNVVWVTRYNGKPDCLDECRTKVAAILGIFSDRGAFWLQDPRLCSWAVGASLVVERNGQRKGFSKLFRSREVEMLERVIADCLAHDGFPPGLADRLRIIESHGVFFPSDIYAAIAADHENANTTLERWKANGSHL